MGRELAEVSVDNGAANNNELMDSTHKNSPHKSAVVKDENSGAKKLPSVKSTPIGKGLKSQNKGSPHSNGEPDHFDPKNTESNSHEDSRSNSEEDENMSVSSSNGAIGTSKFKVTVGTAPKFRIYERIERRKEFNAKMEQKLAAIEEEKLQHQQRLKEEQEAQIKEMRKNLYVKANPVPNFYYEPPPPKPQLKKLPLTRPKSPRLTRRKSCSDASNAERDCSRSYRHAPGGFRAESGQSPTASMRNKSSRNSKASNLTEVAEESNSDNANES